MRHKQIFTVGTKQGRVIIDVTPRTAELIASALEIINPDSEAQEATARSLALAIQHITEAL